jgi:DNA-binding SARP family transcriptional activator
MVAEIDQCNFRILGPVQVATARGPVAFRRPQHLDLLALLLLHVGQVLPVDRIVDAMWGDRVPQTARAQVKNLVSGLRRSLVDGPRSLARLDRLPARPRGFHRAAIQSAGTGGA